MKIYNAKIRSTNLGYTDREQLTAYVNVDFEMGTQGFGGYNLSPEADPKSLGIFINSILGVTGVDTWEKLPGTYVRIKDENNFIVAIGNIIEDSWFEPRNELYNGE